MSTLDMLKAEGKIEGKIEGKAMMKAFKTLESLLTILNLFPKMSLEKMSLLAKVKPILIKQLKVIIKTKKLATIQDFINQNFLENIILNKAEQKEMDALINKLIK